MALLPLCGCAFPPLRARALADVRLWLPVACARSRQDARTRWKSRRWSQGTFRPGRALRQTCTPRSKYLDGHVRMAFGPYKSHLMKTPTKVLENCNTSAVHGGLQARRDVFPSDKPLNIYRGAGPQLDLKSGFAQTLATPPATTLRQKCSEGQCSISWRVRKCHCMKAYRKFSGTLPVGPRSGTSSKLSKIAVPALPLFTCHRKAWH